MNLDLGSFSYGGIVSTGGNTPSWGTSLGQSQPEYKFTYPGADSILIGMMYCSTHLRYVSLPLGKGGKINVASDIPECQLASIFKKVYINDKRIDYPFLMVLIKEESASHTGRRTIKYSDKIVYDDGVSQFSNQQFIKQAKHILGLADESCWFVYNMEVRNQDELHLHAVIVDANNSVDYPDSQTRRKKWLELLDVESKDLYLKGVQNQEDFNKKTPLQQIFYGAPGTGKSNTIKCEVDQKGLPNVRTTFHPDSDYSSFVGAYKPTSIEVPSRDVTGKVIIENGQKVTENRIVYEFVPQAFLKAYTGAWKNQKKPFFLIIEEINRGNCAQIFGDLFQLLDRKNGESEYPISPDEDIQKFLRTDKKFGFAALTEEEKAGIPSEILSGELLKLPKNLYIWATMNTSDQSLFPIDSAFKRRWDWKYIPITEGMENGAPLNWKINVKGKLFDWWQFVEKINDEINEQTKSEDKKLGYFFCKANNGIISADTFVSKVIFYLWNDVFKDQAFGNSIFMDGDDELTFNSFFGNRNGETTIKEEKVEVFLLNLGVAAEGNADEGLTDEIADENAKKQRKEILVSIQIPGNPTILASESSPFESFIKALRIIGLDKVESSLPSLKYKRLDCPVISTQKYDGIANNDKGYSYYKEGNLYIVKGCKSYTYIRILEELDKIYNIGLSMETK